jgi:hypothetical protein
MDEGDKKRQANDLQRELNQTGLSRRAFLDRLKTLGVGFGAASVLGVNNADALSSMHSTATVQSTNPALSTIIEVGRQDSEQFQDVAEGDGGTPGQPGTGWGGGSGGTGGGYGGSSGGSTYSRGYSRAYSRSAYERYARAYTRYERAVYTRYNRAYTRYERAYTRYNRAFSRAYSRAGGSGSGPYGGGSGGGGWGGGGGGYGGGGGR